MKSFLFISMMWLGLCLTTEGAKASEYSELSDPIFELDMAPHVKMLLPAPASARVCNAIGSNNDFYVFAHIKDGDKDIYFLHGWTASGDHPGYYEQTLTPVVVVVQGSTCAFVSDAVAFGWAIPEQEAESKRAGLTQANLALLVKDYVETLGKFYGGKDGIAAGYDATGYPRSWCPEQFQLEVFGVVEAKK